MKVPNRPSGAHALSLSLSRLQNEGSQQFVFIAAASTKSIKATE